MLNGAWWKQWLTGVDDEEDGEDDDTESSDLSQESLELPVARCVTCGGVGQARQPFAPTGYHQPTTCYVCAGVGVLRAQFVITLVDLPTGRVASCDIIPGVLKPVPDKRSQMYLDVAAAVRQLATSLGVDRVYEVSGRRWVERDLRAKVTWSLSYPSNHVISDRWQTEYQAAAIAAAGRGQPQLLLYSGVDLGVLPDPDQALRQLLAASTDLDLDLVIDVRADRHESLRWSVCLAVPGSEIAQNVPGRIPSLRRAVAETSVTTALSNAADRSAQARWPVATRPMASDADVVSWAELSARLTPLALPGPGAVGIYRRHQWFLSSLEAVPDENDDVKTVLRAKNPAPEPEGELIPLRACSRCQGDPGNGCYQCRGSGTQLLGAVLAITDLHGRSKHVDWHPAGPVRPAVSTAYAQAGASPWRTASGFPLRPSEVRLDEHYSVGHHAKDFGVPPHLLRDLATGRQLDRALVDGKISRSASDPVGEYLQAAARRRPGGRVIVLAGPEAEPPTADVLRSIVGLGLTLAITAQSAPLDREDPAPALLAWRIEALPGAADPLELSVRPSSPTLAAAAAQVYDDFDTVVRRALKVGALELLPAPQRPDEVSIDVEAIAACMQTLGSRYPDTTIRLCRTGDFWTCSVASPVLLSTNAETLDDVVAGLSHPDRLLDNSN